MASPGMPQPSGKISRTTSGVVRGSAGYYHGYIVTTVTATGPINVYDNASAASGTIVDVIPATTAAGTQRVLPAPVPMANGIYADFSGGATGAVLFIHDGA